MISGDEGEIWFDGQPIDHIDPVLLRRKVVMLPQQPVLFDGNVRDNLLIGLSFAERPPAGDEQLRQALRLVHLDKELDDLPDSFSGGEKQRLGLARVLLLDPDVLLLDEPTSALDDHTARAVMQKVAEHCKMKGKTLIMITHSRQLADEFADGVIELRQGKISAVRLERAR
jgi:putative ABC transport system ATP-binding protein